MARNWRRTRWLREEGVLLLFAIGLGAQAVIVVPTLLNNTGPRAYRTDFISFYTGPTLLRDGILYDATATRRLQVMHGVRSDQNTLYFVRLPFYAHALTPFSKLSYEVSLGVWTVLVALAFSLGLVMCAYLTGRGAFVAGIWFVPLTSALLKGQDGPVAMLLVATSTLMLTWKYSFGAGFMLAFAAIKWHFLLFIPAFILLRREWRFGMGFASAACLLLLWSWLVMPDWHEHYLKAISRPSVTPDIARMPNVRGLLSHCRALAWVFGSACAAAVLIAVSRTESKPLALNLTVFGGIVLSMHAYIADLTVALPCLLLLAYSRLNTRWPARLLLVPCIPLMLIVGPATFPQIVLIVIPVLVATEAVLKQKLVIAGRIRG